MHLSAVVSLAGRNVHKSLQGEIKNKGARDEWGHGRPTG